MPISVQRSSRIEDVRDGALSHPWSHFIVAASDLNPTPRSVMSELSIVTGAGKRGLVSVVIPTYNRAHLVDQAIQSALRQSYPEVEVIVVDDGSTDNTREVVARFPSRVHYVRQENGGVSAARNTGIRHSRGEFIALLDSDDIWLPWKLRAQVALLERFPEVGMVWTDMGAINAEGELLHPRYLRTMYGAHSRVRIEDVCEHAGRAGQLLGEISDVPDEPFYHGDLFSEMFLGNLVHTSTVVLRRSRLGHSGGFDESLRPAGEDYEFHLRTCASGPVGLYDAPSTLYRIGQDDAITAPRNDVHFARANLKTIVRWLGREGHRIRLPKGSLERCLAFSHAWVGRAEFELGDVRTARRHLWQSLRLEPKQPAVLLFIGLSLLPRRWTEEARRAKRRLRRAFATLSALRTSGLLWLAEPMTESMGTLASLAALA